MSHTPSDVKIRRQLPTIVVQTREMDVKHVITREKKIFDDLNESFLSFSIPDLNTLDEVGEALLSIEEHGREYRHIHVELTEHPGWFHVE